MIDTRRRLWLAGIVVLAALGFLTLGRGFTNNRHDVIDDRIDVVTRTNSYQVRTGDYADDVISVYLIVRRYWGDRPKEAMEDIFENLFERADAICSDKVVPKVVRPLSSAIASRS